MKKTNNQTIKPGLEARFLISIVKLQLLDCQKMTSSTDTFTYWSLLGLPPGSNSEQLKQAFKREAKRWHPDLNRNSKSAEERFKWVNEAYLVLSDPKKRFEWEIAGKPTFEIKQFSQQAQVKTSEPSPNESNSSKIVFNSAEKLLISLIAAALIFVSNTFLF